MSNIVAAVLRSVSPATGAMAGALFVASLVLSGVSAEALFGRASSTSAIAIPFAFVGGVCGAVVGGFVGAVGRAAVARTRWAGPVDPKVVIAVLFLAVVLPGLAALQQVLRVERANQPHILATSPRIVREPALSAEPGLPATVVWDVTRHTATDANAFRWNGQAVRLELNDGALVLQAGPVTAVPPNLTDLDYVREVHAVAARLDQSAGEWLAVLIRLRATGRRELLAIYDPAGQLVHEELFERLTPLLDSPVLWRTPDSAERHRFLLNVGTPVSFGVRERD